VDAGVLITYLQQGATVALCPEHFTEMIMETATAAVETAQQSGDEGETAHSERAGTVVENAALTADAYRGFPRELGGDEPEHEPEPAQLDEPRRDDTYHEPGDVTDHTGTLTPAQ